MFALLCPSGNGYYLAMKRTQDGQAWVGHPDLLDALFARAQHMRGYVSKSFVARPYGGVYTLGYQGGAHQLDLYLVNFPDDCGLDADDCVAAHVRFLPGSDLIEVIDVITSTDDYHQQLAAHVNRSAAQREVVFLVNKVML